MKEVILLRHAKSSWEDPGVSDHDRTLTPRGIKAAILVGKYFHQNRILPDLVLCSTAVRARMTFELVFNELIDDPEVIFNEKIYEFHQDNISSLVSQLPDQVKKVMVVGHNPIMDEMLHKWSQTSSSLYQFKTASFAIFRFPMESWGEIFSTRGELLEFKTPHDLKIGYS